VASARPGPSWFPGLTPARRSRSGSHAACGTVSAPMPPAPVGRAPSLKSRRAPGRLRRLGQHWATGTVAALAVTGASAISWLEPLQVRTLDLIQRLGGQRFPPEVVIVGIDDAAFEKLGARQPIPRAYLARVLRGLGRSGAAVVGFDIARGAAPRRRPRVAGGARGDGDAGGARAAEPRVGGARDRDAPHGDRDSHGRRQRERAVDLLDVFHWVILAAMSGAGRRGRAGATISWGP
jgi:hypothetical protein